jgi:hypothetical protein
MAGGNIFLTRNIPMTIKFFKPSDPKLSDTANSEWIRNNCKVVSIEQLDNDPSAYFILAIKEPRSIDAENVRLIVKHKNFFREHFTNYDEAMQVINQVKEAAYGR